MKKSITKAHLKAVSQRCLVAIVCLWMNHRHNYIKTMMLFHSNAHNKLICPRPMHCHLGFICHLWCVNPFIKVQNNNSKPNWGENQLRNMIRSAEGLKSSLGKNAQTVYFEVLVWPLCYSDNSERRTYWPILQLTTRGQSRCFAFTFEDTQANNGPLEKEFW